MVYLVHFDLLPISPPIKSGFGVVEVSTLFGFINSPAYFGVIGPRISLQIDPFDKKGILSTWSLLNHITLLYILNKFKFPYSRTYQ